MLGTLLPCVVLCLFVGCGSRPPEHEHPDPLSVEEHEQHAKAHEAEADVTQSQVEPQSGDGDVQCIDQGVPLTSGGEEIRVMKPCWTRAEQNAAYLRAAEAHRKAAKDHRAWAQLLIEVEKTACKDLGAIERKTSPFVRRPDILSVEEYRESGKLMGARVTFRKVKGLSQEWLLKSMKCHQARAAKLGYPEEFMPRSPLALEKTSVSTTETKDTVVATVRSPDPIVAAEIYGRASRADSAEAQ